MTSPTARRSTGATPIPAARRMPMAWPLSLLVGALVVALAAQVTVPVPGTAVPMTLQGLAVILVGGLFGSAIGAGAMVLYLIAGAFGAPVFAPGGVPGLARLLGPTGGYLLAFPLAAAVVGRVGLRGSLPRSFLAALAGMVVIHLGGWAQLSLLSGNAGQALALGVAPFLVPDLLKVVIAGLVLWRGHHLFRSRV